MPRSKPARYSIQVIDDQGNPIPRSESTCRMDAVSLAEMIALETGREVRVWNRQTARFIYTVPARREARYAA